MHSIHEDPGIHMPLDAIEAFNYHAIAVCLNEVVIQENSPHSMQCARRLVLFLWFVMFERNL